jgi:hypothetical protein
MKSLAQYDIVESKLAPAVRVLRQDAADVLKDHNLLYRGSATPSGGEPRGSS